MDVQEEEVISAIEDEDEEVEVDINDDVNMTWACFNPFFAYVKEKDAKNFTARCRLCNEEKSCNVTSSNNLKSHLKVSQ